jgi:hypothetical protein
MTAAADLPPDSEGRPTGWPMSPEQAREETKGRPRRDQAEDGRGQGKAAGATAAANAAGRHRGDNAQSGEPRGSETERDAPGA